MKKNDKPIINHILDFLEYIDVEKNLGNKTQLTYHRLLKKFSDWLTSKNMASLLPHQLTSEIIWDYRVFLSKNINKNNNQSLKKSSQNYYLIALRNLLNYFADRDILSLPSEKIKLSKKRKDIKVKFLNLDQVEKLLLAPNISSQNGLRDRAILETLFSTGTRVAELSALDKDQIKIPPAMDELEISIVGKGGKIRPIYFSARCLRWLKKYLDSRENDTEKALFIRYKGQTNGSLRLTTRSIESIVKKHAIRAGVPIFTVPHTLRHTFATDMLAKGVDIRTLQEFLGHSDISTTQIYTHVVSKQLKDIHHKFHSGSDLKE
ncbi:MAG: tyrosine-type recombinase/integrase [bacterium]|nr:tyrosine-type recombinase/integrase [bacterium]